MSNVTAHRLTGAMKRELRSLAMTGEVGDLRDYRSSALAFYAREKTLGALLRRDLIASACGGFMLTDAGRSALVKGAA